MGLLVGATCRAVYALTGAVAMVRRKRLRPLGARAVLKDALETWRLLYSPHTDGLTAEQAVKLVSAARTAGLDPFDLWCIFESYNCEDLEQAVIKALEMQAFWARPFSPRIVA